MGDIVKSLSLKKGFPLDALSIDGLFRSNTEAPLFQACVTC